MPEHPNAVLVGAAVHKNPLLSYFAQRPRVCQQGCSEQMRKPTPPCPKGTASSKHWAGGGGSTHLSTTPKPSRPFLALRCNPTRQGECFDNNQHSCANNLSLVALQPPCGSATLFGHACIPISQYLHFAGFDFQVLVTGLGKQPCAGSLRVVVSS